MVQNVEVQASRFRTWRARCCRGLHFLLRNTDIPSSGFIDGVYARHFSGTGVVIYHSKTMGIVAVDKNTVPTSVSDVNLEFASNLMNIPGDVVFLHPIHNYALVAYDPAALGPAGAAAVRAAVLCPQPALQKGDTVYLVGLNQSSKSQSRKSTVKNTVAALNIRQCAYPRYRAMNMEVIELDTDFGNSFSGVLTDELAVAESRRRTVSDSWNTESFIFSF
jgi:hypothetical protein